jgi:hypothetical protein
MNFISCVFIAMLIASVPVVGQFAQCVDSGLVNVDALVDASAMASSKLQDSVVWVCNGHSDNSKFYALDTHGKLIAAYYLKVRWQRNWEDMASGPGPDPSRSYLYIADIGDNDSQWPVKTIYRFIEPLAQISGIDKIDTIATFDKLDFTYPDSIHDAEAMMIDPLTKDYYILTKEKEKSRIYRATYPQPINEVDTLEYIDSIPYRMVTAADISSSGDEIFVKEYFRISYWKRAPGESIVQALLRPTKQKIPYIMEKAGEALCWSRNADAYFTVSEEADSVPCRLYYYVRNNLNSHRSGYSLASINNHRSPHTFLTFPAGVINDDPSDYFTIAGSRIKQRFCGATLLIKAPLKSR